MTKRPVVCLLHRCLIEPEVLQQTESFKRGSQNVTHKALIEHRCPQGIGQGIDCEQRRFDGVEFYIGEADGPKCRMINAGGVDECSVPEQVTLCRLDITVRPFNGVGDRSAQTPLDLAILSLPDLGGCKRRQAEAKLSLCIVDEDIKPLVLAAGLAKRVGYLGHDVGSAV